MAAGSTYTPIATTTLTGSASTIDFNSISGSYTDLVLVITAKVSSQQDLYIRCNGDTGSNYSHVSLYGTGSSAGSEYGSNSSNGLLTDYYGSPTTNNNHIAILNFMNYSNTTTYKTMIGRSNRVGSGLDAIVSLWRSTAAITSLTLRFPGSETFSAGTVATLYGITAA